MSDPLVGIRKMLDGAFGGTAALINELIPYVSCWSNEHVIVYTKNPGADKFELQTFGHIARRRLGLLNPLPGTDRRLCRPASYTFLLADRDTALHFAEDIIRDTAITPREDPDFEALPREQAFLRVVECERQNDLRIYYSQTGCDFPLALIDIEDTDKERRLGFMTFLLQKLADAQLPAPDGIDLAVMPIPTSYCLNYFASVVEPLQRGSFLWSGEIQLSGRVFLEEAVDRMR